MKYAALIFGDDERQPKAASNKLSSPEPGQVVRGIDGSIYRVASKIAGPDGYAVKLANLQGQPVQTPKNFRPVGTATMRLASWLKYHLAYNRDFDLYVNSYIERHNENVAKYNKDIERHNSTIPNPKNQIPLEEPLPYPVGHDGKAFRWANWFQSVISPKLFVPGHGDAEERQSVKDELIHEMLFTVLGHRDILSQFAAKAKSLGVNKENAANKLTNFLISSFMYRIHEMQNKLKELMPEGEISLWQPSTSGEFEGDVNILEQEEYGVGGEEFQSAEARKDVAKFREGFSKWLIKTQGEKAANNFILLFDIFWRILQEDEDAEVRRSDLQQEWIDKTGLSFGSFKVHLYRLPEMVEQFIVSHSSELGDKNIFVDLMNLIRTERTKRERGEQRQRKQQQRQPAMASLHLAASEDDEKFTCSKCHRTSNASDSNNLQCPHCGGNMKTAEYTQEDWERDERSQYDLERIEEAKHWEGEDDDKTARKAKRGSARTYSKTAETVATQHGAMSYEADDVVNPDSFIPNGEFNPHKVRPFLIHNEFGTLAIVYADNEQDALDEAADADKLDSVQVDEEEYFKADEEGHSDEYANLGNAGQPFDLTYIGLIPLPNQQYGVPEVQTDEMLQGYEKEITEENDKKFLKDMGIQGSRKIAQKLLRGDQLTPEMIKQVQDAFIYRWTTDNKRRGEVYHCDKCDVQQNPYVNETSAEGHQHPTIPLQTDDQWLKEHAFYFTNAGRLQPRRHAVPAYLAPQESQPTLASVVNKFAMEKAAYNPGKGQYIYKADVYCEKCGQKLAKKLWGTVNDNGDSDTFPQGPFYEQEADGPEHCANCGEFLENPLTTAGYQYLNQMILEHEADGKGQSDIIDEWKAFYPERTDESYTPGNQVDDALQQVEKATDKKFLNEMGIQGAKKAAISNRGWFEVTHNSNDFQCPHCGAGLTDEEWNTEGGDKLSGDYEVECPDCGKPFIVDIAVETRYHTQPKKAGNKKAMIPHEFNNADGQAIRPETNPQSTDYVEGEADTTEFRQPRMAAGEQWKCMDCGNVGQLTREGRCEVCESEAVHPETPHVQRPALPIEPTDPSTFRETKPIDVEKRMVPIRQRNISPNRNPMLGSDKTAQGSGNTTVTMQEQNATIPSTPGKGQPLAVPDAIDQVPGPHSPNAPATAPRSPGIQPRVVNVPAGTEGDDTMSIPQTASARDPEEISCPKCGGDNVDVDATEEGYSIYCEDCEQVTHQGRLAPGRPTRDYRETPGDEFSTLERLGEPEGELSEPDVDSMYEAERLDQFDREKGAASTDHNPYATYDRLKKKYDDTHEVSYEGGRAHVVEKKHPDIYEELEEEGRQDKELSEEIAKRDEQESWSQEQKEAWLVEHGWVKDDEHHGAAWWMQKPMWTKTDHEEDIPYQDTDEAIEKELELLEAEEFPRTAAGSNSGDDDARGVGDLYRENFYEHRTEGLSSDGMLSGMKDAAGGNPAFEELDGVWTSPDQAPTDEEIELLGNYLAQTGTATSVPSGVMLAKKWRQERWAVSGDEDRDLLKSMGIQAGDEQQEKNESEFRGMFDFMNSLDWRGRNPWYPAKYPWFGINVYSDGWIARNDLAKEQLGEGTGLDDLKKFLSKYNLEKLRSGYVDPEEEPEEPEFNSDDKELMKSMGIKAKKAVSLSNAEQLAREFARELTLELGPETMKEVVELNGAETLPNVCHSHDFCDANMTMQRAGANLGLWKDNEADVNDEATVKLWNEAWEIAVDNNFWVGESKAAAVAPPPAPVVSPNVVQNQSLAQNPGVQAPGTSVAIIPEEGQGQEDPGTLKRHTVEPELPNARYHMMGALITAEEQRLTEELGPEYDQWSEEALQQEPEHPSMCEECGQERPDVEWFVSEDFASAEDPTQPYSGWLCKDCISDLAQDI